MTRKPKQDDSDITNAKLILDKGWRQGSIFDPRGILEEITLKEKQNLVLA